MLDVRLNGRDYLATESGFRVKPNIAEEVVEAWESQLGWNRTGVSHLTRVRAFQRALEKKGLKLVPSNPVEEIA